MVGLVVFTIGSLLCGLSWSEGSLIAARALQGLGAATISPAALSILTTMFREGRERNIALGAWGAVGGVGAAAGVLLGGVLVDLLSWPWIFFVNVPVGIVCADRGADPARREPRRARVELRRPRGRARHLRAQHPRARDHEGPRLGLVVGPDDRRLRSRAAVLLAGFIAQESRAAQPLMPFSIFRLQTLTAANIVMFIMGTALFSMFLMLTLYMQQVLHFSPLKTGIGYLAVAGTAIIWANVAAAAVTRVGVKPTLVIGMSRDDGRPRPVHAGVGRRLVLEEPLPGLPRDRLRHAASRSSRLRSRRSPGRSEHEAGLASGLINTSQQIGGAVGIAILSTIATSTTSRCRRLGNARARRA